MFKKSNLLSYCYRCGLPVCNEVCEEGPLHKNNECPLFAKAFDNSDDEYDNKEGHAKSSKLPKIENLHAPCPLYTCITPLRLLLREWNAEKTNTELVRTLFVYLCRKIRPVIFIEEFFFLLHDVEKLRPNRLF